MWVVVNFYLFYFKFLVIGSAIHQLAMNLAVVNLTVMTNVECVFLSILSFFIDYGLWMWNL